MNLTDSATFICPSTISNFPLLNKIALESSVRCSKGHKNIWPLPLLIHLAEPQSRPVVITIFTKVVCTYVFQSVHPSVPHKTSKSSDNHCGLAEWIIHDSSSFFCFACRLCLVVGASIFFLFLSRAG